MEGCCGGPPFRHSGSLAGSPSARHSPTWHQKATSAPARSRCCNSYWLSGCKKNNRSLSLLNLDFRPPPGFLCLGFLGINDRSLLQSSNASEKYFRSTANSGSLGFSVVLKYCKINRLHGFFINVGEEKWIHLRYL